LLLVECAGVQHVDFKLVGVVIYVACLLWGRCHPKFVVVDWVTEVLVDGADEVVPIKKLCMFGETDVPVVCYTNQV
jgi:hypothetical protein